MTTIFPGHISLRFLKMSFFDTNVCEVVALSFLVDSAKDSRLVYSHSGCSSYTTTPTFYTIKVA